MDDPILRKLGAEGSAQRAFERLAQRLVRDATDADDLVQEAHLAAIRKDDGPFRAPWIFGAIRVLARNRHRRTARRNLHESRAARADLVPPTDAIVERLEQRRLLSSALLSLDPIYRDILYLRYFENEPPRVIAKRLGLSKSATESRLRRGLDELRKRLDRRFDGNTGAWVCALAPLASTGRALLSLKSGAILMNVKTKTATVAALLLLLTAGAFFIRRSTDGTNDGDLARHPREATNAVAGAPARSARAHAAPESEPESRSATVRDAIPRTATPKDHDVRAFHVKMVDAVTQKPVPFADLYARETSSLVAKIDTPSERAWFRRLMIDSDGPLAAYRALGTHYRGDENGETTVPRGAIEIHFYAADDHREGQGYAAPDQVGSEVIVKLGEVHEITVRVTDESGQAMSDVPVFVRRHPDSAKTIGLGGARTKKDGLAHIRARDVIPLDVERYSIGIGILSPFATAERREVILADWPKDIVALKCPSTGILDVRVIDTDGRPLEDGVIVTIKNTREVWYGEQRRAETMNGHAVFPAVGIGAEIECSADMYYSQPLAKVTTTGPDHANETKGIDLVVNGHFLKLRMRLIDPAGRPWSGGDAIVDVTKDRMSGEAIAHQTLVRPEADGRCEWRIFETGEPGADAHVVIRPEKCPPGMMIIGECRFPKHARDSVVDLGDVVLPIPEPIATGTVVDRDGQALANMDVEVLVATESSAHTATPDWQSKHNPPSRTGRDGRFAIFAGGSAGEVQALRVRARGTIRHAPQPFMPGDRDLRLVCESASAIHGRFDFAGAARSTDLAVLLWPRRLGARPVQGTGAGWIARSPLPPTDDTFEFPGLDAGRYDLVVGSVTRPDFAIVVEDIVLPENTELSDPRLNPLVVGPR